MYIMGISGCSVRVVGCGLGAFSVCVGLSGLE